MKTHWKTALIRSTFVLVAAAITDCSSVPADDRNGQKSTETFTEPPVVASSAGVLRISLTPAPSTLSVAGRQATAMAYNGLYIPPTLRVRPGDTIRLRLTNALAEPTNLHTHGLAVSPLGNSDNI